MPQDHIRANGETPSAGMAPAPDCDDASSAARPEPAGWTTQALCAFSQFAGWSAAAMGSASAFVIATAACLLWALSGPLFAYSDTWQLVINTATTVLTFLAVFLIQHTQNKEGRALQLKLDELIRATEQARDQMIDLEHCTDEELTIIQSEFSRRRPVGSSTPPVTRSR